ncbi:MAG: hypothetical protein MUC84_02555 [Solirubrobacteraceae bacterium]|jgi:hypothetical protein|nr:hypothetical protein [Solirubrobacteraceae bacterium]MCU0312928.1 hypothetical protein [Solirubrobacteraceae bacterium]
MGLWARVRARLRRNEHAADGVHDDDRLPTSAMVPGAAASGVWEPRHKDSFLSPGDHHGPPDDDFLKPRVK